MRISKPMRKLGSAASIACLLALPVMAQATNGYYAHGYGAKQNAIAGSLSLFLFSSAVKNNLHCCVGG